MTSRQHSPEEIEDYAMRMAWAGIADEHKAAFIEMAKSAIVVHEHLMARARFNAIVSQEDA